MSKITFILSVSIKVFLIGFLLNFFWESVHAIAFYNMGLISTLDYEIVLVKASVIDACIILGVFLSGYLFWKEKDWFERLRGKHYLYLGILWILIAIAIEIKGVYLFKDWSYNETMPLIFGIGLSPLVQLVLTGYITVQCIRKN